MLVGRQVARVPVDHERAERSGQLRQREVERQRVAARIALMMRQEGDERVGGVQQPEVSHVGGAEIDQAAAALPRPLAQVGALGHQRLEQETHDAGQRAGRRDREAGRRIVAGEDEPAVAGALDLRDLQGGVTGQVLPAEHELQVQARDDDLDLLGGVVLVDDPHDVAELARFRGACLPGQAAERHAGPLLGRGQEHLQTRLVGAELLAEQAAGRQRIHGGRPDDAAVRQDGVDLEQGQPSVGQRLGVDLHGADAPRERDRGVLPELDFAEQGAVTLLEVLRAQEHALLPDDPVVTAHVRCDPFAVRPLTICPRSGRVFPGG